MRQNEEPVASGIRVKNKVFLSGKKGELKKTIVMSAKKRVWLSGFIGIGCLLFILGACASGKVQQRNDARLEIPVKHMISEIKPCQLSEEDQRKYSYFFLEAMRQKEKGSYDAAYDLLRHALVINPDASEALFEMAHFYDAFFLDSTMNPRPLLERAVALDQNNYFYSQALAELYLRRNDMKNGIQMYEEMTDHFKDNSEILARLVSLYEMTSDYNSVVRVLNRLEKKEGKSEAISMEKVKMYTLLKDTAKAYTEIEDLCKEYPNDMRYRVVLGDFYMQNERLQEAYEIYQKVLTQEPENIYAKVSLLSYYEHIGNDSLYNMQIDSVVLNPNASSKMKTEILKSFIVSTEVAKGDSTRVLSLLHKAIMFPQQDLSLLEMTQAYMQLKKMPMDSIIPIWNKMLSQEPDKESARLMLLDAAYKKQDIEGAARLCLEGVQYNPDQLLFYFYGGNSLFRLNREQEAMELFEKGLDKIGGAIDLDFASNYYAVLGDIYHQLGYKDKSYAAYDSCLSYNADNIICMNNYAYFLSLDKKNLDKAEEMAARVVKAEPTNSTYLDTYAWIFFVKGDYQKAKIYIDETLKHISDTPENAGIFEHAGDIYAKCGKTKEALSFWKRAERLGEGSAVLKKKIKNKKYFAK